MIDIIIVIISSILVFILIVMYLIILFTDFDRDKCELCKTKIEHKGYNFVYCDKCKHKTYLERI